MRSAVRWSADLGGRLHVSLVQAGTFRLDVGSALGIVPKVLWQSRVNEEIDAEYRIPQALNCLVIDSPSGRVLVETGIGERLDDRRRRLRGVEGEPVLPSLRAAGFEPESIDFVVLSHLHFDHAGGLLAADGAPAFPRALIVAQRKEWEIALLDNPRVAASYDQAELKIANRSALPSSSDGDVVLLDSIDLVLTGGHTAGHQCVIVRGARSTLAYFGDLAMRPWSISPGWTTAFDDFPLDSVTAKEKLFAQADDERWLVALSHERKQPIGRIERNGSRFQYVAV